MMVQRHSAADCLREPLVNDLPLKCQQLKKGFGECRRGMVDMRKRFRGNQNVTFGQVEQTNKTGDGYQLYAGKSAFSGTRGETDGDGKEPADWREVENQKYRDAAAAAASEKPTKP